MAELFGIMVAIGVFWVLPITLGVRSAKRKGYSPLWMGFGIYPVAGWILLLVFVCLPPRARRLTAADLGKSDGGPAPGRPVPGFSADPTDRCTSRRGTRVVTCARTPLKVGNRVIDDGSLHRIYTVESVNGPWLWVVSGGVSGWPFTVVVPQMQVMYNRPP